MPALETLTASDGVKLAYRRYLPATPRAVVLFYHGGGAHNAAGYQTLASSLQTQYAVAVFLPDLRGHGASEGSRGDSPSPKQVWDDVSTFITHIRTQFPTLPLILGGHSSGAGLILNYSSQPNHQPVDNYIFLSPEFGFRSRTARPTQSTPFAQANTTLFIINAISAGWLFGHAHAVRFNYPQEILDSDPGLVASYTVNMANAVTPSAPQSQFANLDRAFGLWLGADDELLLPASVLGFADLATQVQISSEIGSIPNTNHLSVLTKAHATIGPWLARLEKRKQR